MTTQRDDSKSLRRSMRVRVHRHRRWFGEVYTKFVTLVKTYPVIFFLGVVSLNVGIHLVMSNDLSLPTHFLSSSRPFSNRVFLKPGEKEPIPSIERSDAQIMEIPTMTTLDMEMGGGFFRKREKSETPIWDEYSEDGKRRFAFEEKEWNDEYLELFDKARSMWIKIKYHLHGFSHQITPTVEFKQKADGKYSLLDRICNTGKRPYAGRNMRLCSRANAVLDQRNRDWVKRNPLPVHYIVSVTDIQYFEWQARNSYYWFRKTQPETSNYTRLLAADKPDHLMDEIPTFLTKHWNISEDNYVAYNKPYSILQWVLAGNPVNEDIVGILDVDMCLLEDFTHFGVGVEEGAPMSQTGFMWFPNDNSSFDKLAAEFCNDCKVIDSLAVPTFIHKNDLREMAQRWLDKTKEIRKVTRKGLKGYQTDKELQLSWTPEMYGYIFGASEMGLSHRTRADMQEYTVGGDSPSERKLNRPAIHFSMHMTMADGYKWTKGHENASWYIPPAYEKNEVSMRLSHELRDARDHLPKLNNSYNGYRVRLSS